MQVANRRKKISLEDFKQKKANWQKNQFLFPIFLPAPLKVGRFQCTRPPFPPSFYRKWLSGKRQVFAWYILTLPPLPPWRYESGYKRNFYRCLCVNPNPKSELFLLLLLLYPCVSVCSLPPIISKPPIARKEIRPYILWLEVNQVRRKIQFGEFHTFFRVAKRSRPSQKENTSSP